MWKVVRFYATQKILNNELKKYTATINLPKTQFPNRLNAEKRQQSEQVYLQKIGACYEQQLKQKRQPAFILHDGPPYANGQLHMGHAVNKILKDITLRKHVAQGRAVDYVPGWDCHGLPIELKALSAAKSVQEKQQQQPDALSVRKFSREFATQAIASQKQEFASWGVLANWQEQQRCYRTYDANFISKQLQLFWDLHERGFIYRDLKPVFWSPSSGSALAEAELTYDENFVSPSVFVRFRLTNLSARLKQLAQENDVYALVWTTTPWTLPSNQAICFNESLNYALVKLPEPNTAALYIVACELLENFQQTTKINCDILSTFEGSLLQECTYAHPLQPKSHSLPFWSAEHVKSSKGTGLVHTAPAHGADDFLINLTKKLPVLSLVDASGKYNEQAPAFLQGKEVLSEGNLLVSQHLAQDIVWAGSLTHSYPMDWRTNKPVIVRASEQWFINTERLKEQAILALENITVFPRVHAMHSKQMLSSQLQKRPYWCISRQRAWGVPIPVLYNKQNGQAIINSDFIKHLRAETLRRGNIDFWWQQNSNELVPNEVAASIKLPKSDLEKGMDIFDIWFDSGSTWANVLEANEQADLYMEGYDQFTGWFQSSLLVSIAARDIAPYKSIFVHGFTVDEHGHKMSKSLGNVISPFDVRRKYGADALRWWVAAHATQHMSITVSDKLLQQAAESVQKMRTTLRFLNGVLGDGCKKGEEESLSQNNEMHINLKLHLNRYLLSQLHDFDIEIQRLYDCYEYNHVIANIQHFVVNQVSALYIHSIKDRLYCGNDEELKEIQYTMRHCYKLLCKALWPITPFVVEESWSYYDDRKHDFSQQNVVSESSWKNAKVEQIINGALLLKRLVNQKLNIQQNSWSLSLTVGVKNVEQLQLLQALHPVLNQCLSDTELCEILQVGGITLRHIDTPAQQYDDDNNMAEPEIEIGVEPMPNGNYLCPRCRRFSVQIQHEICERCSLVICSKNA